jgi:hypothetical protein
MKFLPVSLLFMAVLPFLSAEISFFRGSLVYGKNTRIVSIGVGINLVVLLVTIAGASVFIKAAGVYIASGAYVLAAFSEFLFLYIKNKSSRDISEDDNS